MGLVCKKVSVWHEGFPSMHEVSSKLSENRVSLHMWPLTPAFTSFSPQRCVYVVSYYLEKWEKVSLSSPLSSLWCCLFKFFVIGSATHEAHRLNFFMSFSQRKIVLLSFFRGRRCNRDLSYVSCNFMFHLTLWLCSGQIDPRKIFFFPKILVNVIALDSNSLTLCT